MLVDRVLRSGCLGDTVAGGVKGGACACACFGVNMLHTRDLKETLSGVWLATDVASGVRSGPLRDEDCCCSVFGAAEASCCACASDAPRPRDACALGAGADASTVWIWVSALKLTRDREIPVLVLDPPSPFSLEGGWSASGDRRS